VTFLRTETVSVFFAVRTGSLNKRDCFDLKWLRKQEDTVD